MSATNSAHQVDAICTDCRGGMRCQLSADMDAEQELDEDDADLADIWEGVDVPGPSADTGPEACTGSHTDSSRRPPLWDHVRPTCGTAVERKSWAESMRSADLFAVMAGEPCISAPLGSQLMQAHVQSCTAASGCASGELCRSAGRDACAQAGLGLCAASLRGTTAGAWTRGSA